MTQHLGVQGTSYQALRPFQPNSRPLFEALGIRLVDRLCAVPPLQYDPIAAYVCAVLSAWSYADAHAVSTMMVRLGLERNRCRYIGLTNAAMFICSTAYFVQSACGRLGLLVYRGTEPINLISWLTDADVSPIAMPVSGPSSNPAAPPPVSSGAKVHQGFYRNQRSTWFDVERALDLAIAGRSVLTGVGESPEGSTSDPATYDSASPPDFEKLEALYVTGHSLGGAMAAIAGFRLAHDPRFAAVLERTNGVYTYGQPMVGNDEWVTLCKGDRYRLLRDGLFRHVYDRDVVPSLPPTEAGSFAHTGRELRSAPIDQARLPAGATPGPCWQATAERRQQASLAEVPGAIAAFVQKELPGSRGRAKGQSWLRAMLASGGGLLGGLFASGYSLYDHFPPGYLLTSQVGASLALKQPVLNEFGDF